MSQKSELHLQGATLADILSNISIKYRIPNEHGSLVRWGTPGNCSNYGEILEHPGAKEKTELNLSKIYPLKEKKNHNSAVKVFELSGGSHLTN